ncbi:MAG: hypothetical protein JO209_04515 [Acidisphaera sp.]|nr:hypothetical protein [Acidisphaera sp.]
MARCLAWPQPGQPRHAPVPAAVVLLAALTLAGCGGDGSCRCGSIHVRCPAHATCSCNNKLPSCKL